MLARTALQVLRILTLLLLLRVTGWAVVPMQRAVTSMHLSGAVQASITLSLVSLLFVVVMLVGRRAWHPWAILTIEAVIAAVLALVPAVLWIIWFGISGWANTMVAGPVQPLAAAWLGVVLLRGFHQWRRTDPRTDTPQDTDEGRRVTSG